MRAFRRKQRSQRKPPSEWNNNEDATIDVLAEIQKFQVVKKDIGAEFSSQVHHHV
jgi:hypothetical protein